MDKIREDRWIHYRRAEKIIKDIEENEAKKDEAIRLQIEAHRSTSRIGPVNGLLRFFYILEQQNQSDTAEIRAKARDDLLKYIDPSGIADPAVEEKEEEEEQGEEEAKDIDHPPHELPQSTPIISINPQSTAVSSQSTVTAPTAPPVSVAASVPQPPPAFSPIPASLTDDARHITPNTQARYEKLLSQAQEYEKRYTTIDAARKKALSGPLKGILNRLRKETLAPLTNELLGYLNGQEQKVLNQSIRIANNDERLLCLSMTTSLIFNQLLGGDLNDVQTEILLPLVGELSGNEQHKEFRTIFLDRLHKKCPYTVPFYPKRLPSMSDKQYYEAMGYVMKKDGEQTRLENETEFLNRMSGLIRFFCKLLVRRGPPFDNQLSYAWAWMADVLNLPPQRQITALIIRIFLDEAGASMIKQYAKQFVKILQAVQQQYLPRLETTTTPDQMTRLRLILETLTKTP